MSENVNFNTFLSFIKEAKNNFGMFKAVFLVGGPGSGKDYIMRESGLADPKINELNINQIYEMLMDKHQLSLGTGHNHVLLDRLPVLVNGGADNFEKVQRIREELEELGYESMMLFVNTTNQTSIERNQRRNGKMMDEEIRYNKWTVTQENYNHFNNLFGEDFISWDNSNETLQEAKRGTVKDLKLLVNLFFRKPIRNEAALDWMKRNEISELFDRSMEYPISSVDAELPRKKIKSEQNPTHASVHQSNINKLVRHLDTLPSSPNKSKPSPREIKNLKTQKDAIKKAIQTQRELQSREHRPFRLHRIDAEFSKIGENNVSENTELVQEKTRTNTNTTSRTTESRVTESAPLVTYQKDKWKSDNIGYDEGKSPQAPKETAKGASQPTIIIKPEKKPTKFQSSSETSRNKDRKAKKDTKITGTMLPNVRGTGVSNTYDTRGQGSVFPMSGLQDPAFRAGFGEDADYISPVTGMSNGGSTVEPMVEPHMQYGKPQLGPTETKKKKKREKVEEAMSEPNTPEDIAKKHGVSVDSIHKQLEIGMEIEHEHTKSNKQARKIALDHLAEFPDYYTRLKKMELKAKKGLKENSLDEGEGAGMSARDLHRHVIKKGWTLTRTNGPHDIYTHPESTKIVKIPRHTHVNRFTAKDVLDTSVHFDKKAKTEAITFNSFLSRIEESDEPAYLKEEVHQLLEFVSDDEINFNGDEEQFIDSVEWELDEEPLEEAEYQGRKVPLGKPMKGDVKKSKVFVRGPSGRVVKVNFGDKNMKIKKNIPARRRSFRARHKCANPGPRTKARYWSCKAW